MVVIWSGVAEWEIYIANGATWTHDVVFYVMFTDFLDAITNNISIRITFYLCYYDIALTSSLQPPPRTHVLRLGVKWGSGEKSILPKMCVWLRAFHYCCRCVAHSPSLIVFHIKYYWNLFLISLSLSPVNRVSVASNVYITSVMVKKAKHIREEIILFMYIRREYELFMYSSHHLWGAFNLLMRASERFHQGFISHARKNVPAGKM